MRRFAFGLVIACAIAGLAAGGVGAAAPPPAQTIVKVFRCFNEGTTLVPAGSDIVLQTGWASDSGHPGQVSSFIAAIRTAGTLNGTPIANPDSYWGPVFYRADFDTYQSNWTYDTHITLKAGQKLALTFSQTLHSPYFDMIDPVTNRPVIAPAGLFASGSCTIKGK